MAEREEIPIADAIEQQQEIAPEPDEDAAAYPATDVPLEAPDADWQEQQEEVIDDPEERSE